MKNNVLVRLFLLVFFSGIFVVNAQKQIDRIGNNDSVYSYNGGQITSARFVKYPILNSLQEDSVLKFIYPGSLYQVNFYDSDTLNVVLWYCVDCRPEKMVFTLDEDTLLFVDTVLYDSRLLSLDVFEDGEKNRYAWVGINTTEAQPDFLLTGRFCSGILSLALLKQEAEGWRLVSLDKAVGGFGMFCMAPKPKLVEYQKNHFGLTLTESLGGPGGPYMGSLYLYDVVNGKIQELLSLEMADFELIENCTWHTSVVLNPDSLKTDEIILETSGMVDKSVLELNEFDFSYLPAELNAALQKKKMVSFKYLRTYKLVDARYQLVNMTFKTL